MAFGKSIFPAGGSRTRNQTDVPARRKPRTTGQQPEPCRLKSICEGVIEGATPEWALRTATSPYLEWSLQTLVLIGTGASAALDEAMACNRPDGQRVAGGGLAWWSPAASRGLADVTPLESTLGLEGRGTRRLRHSGNSQLQWV